jgi:broad specificity phosphatase PhoE
VGRLLLIRHAESEGNRDQVFTATPLVPLTPRGRLQAHTAASWMSARYSPIRVVTSPYQRARETAAIIGEVLQLPIVVEEDLHERDYGSLAGLAYATPRPGYDRERYWTWRPDAGETLEEVLVRVGAALDRIAEVVPHGDVIVVSHGAVMMAAYRHVTGMWPPAGRVVRNAGIVVAEHRDGRWRETTEVPGNEEGPVG